jgi:hypothetical protein
VTGKKLLKPIDVTFSGKCNEHNGGVVAIFSGLIEELGHGSERGVEQGSFEGLRGMRYSFGMEGRVKYNNIYQMMRYGIEAVAMKNPDLVAGEALRISVDYCIPDSMFVDINQGRPRSAEMHRGQAYDAKAAAHVSYDPTLYKRLDALQEQSGAPEEMRGENMWEHCKIHVVQLYVLWRIRIIDEI